MPPNLDPREVLSYLNELGYTNITGKQLKLFMKDLMKLIKSDERQQARYQYSEYSDVEEEPSSVAVLDTPRESGEDVFHILYNSETVASSAKRKTKQSPCKTINIHIKRNSEPSHKPIVPRIVIPEQTDSGKSTATTTDSMPKHSTKQVPTASRDCLLKSGQSHATASIASRKSQPKSARSFIRPRMQAKPLKSDPVALYHQYKQIWSKIKFPGEHQHGETRWAIRERLLGDY